MVTMESWVLATTTPIGWCQSWSEPLRGELLSKAVVQVAAGYGHSMCVASDGSVYLWGDTPSADAMLGLAELPVLVQALDINSTQLYVQPKQ